MRDRLSQIEALLEISHSVNADIRLGTLQIKIINYTRALLECENASILLWDSDNQQFVGGQSTDVGGEVTQRVRNKAGATEWIKTYRKPLVINEIRDDPFSTNPMIREYGIESYVGIPVSYQNELVGVLYALSHQANHFDEEDVRLLQTFANLIAIAIRNARSHELQEKHIVELQRLYSNVEQLERFKTQMLHLLAHDLRSPIATAIGYIELCKLDLWEQLTGEHRMFVTNIEASLDNAVQVGEDVLSLARLDSSVSLQFQELLVFTDLVQDVVADYQSVAGLKEQSLTSQIPSHSRLKLLGDQILLKRAMSNLVGNAIKYTPVKGRVTVNVMQNESHVIFKVEDTGYGIPDEQQKHLFQPFHRADSEETRDIDGIGLGLHLVKNIIESHNGLMIFHSIYGKGSTFGFKLPLPRSG